MFDPMQQPMSVDAFLASLEDATPPEDPTVWLSKATTLMTYVSLNSEALTKELIISGIQRVMLLAPPAMINLAFSEIEEIHKLLDEEDKE